LGWLFYGVNLAIALVSAVGWFSFVAKLRHQRWLSGFATDGKYFINRC
jgi:hypothetical protein